MQPLAYLQQYWSKLMAQQLRLPSGILARFTGNKMNQANAALYQLTLAQLAVQDGHTILEIGFGNGKFFGALHEQAANLALFGVEHSPEMVNAAIQHNLELHQRGQLKVTIGSSDKLPFHDQVFDRIFCINVIYFWEDPTVHLQEIRRVLKPGGYFCAGFRPKENLKQFPFAQHGFVLYQESEWRATLEAQGFRWLKSARGESPVAGSGRPKIPFESLCVVGVK